MISEQISSFDDDKVYFIWHWTRILQPKKTRITSFNMLSAVLILSFISSLAAFSLVSNYASTKLSMSTEGMSKSLPFLKKPKNLDGLVVSYSVNNSVLPSFYRFLAFCRATQSLILLVSPSNSMLSLCERLSSSTAALPCLQQLAG